MNLVLSLLNTLHSYGIKLGLDNNGDLLIRGDKSALTQSLVDEIRSSKQEIVKYLKLNHKNGSGSTITQVEKDKKSFATSFAQQRLWLLDQIDNGSPHYNMAGWIKLSGFLNCNILTQAFGSILERHESLRTCFRVGDDGQPLQVIQAVAPFAVPLLDLSGLAEGERQTQLAQRIAEEASKAFDLSRDLMLRAQLLKVAADEHILLVTMHHIAADGWSMAILLNEFSALYGAYVEEKENPLAPLPIQYADYAHWQRNWLQGEVLDEQLGYWTDQLANLPVAHSVPLDHARPLLQSFAGDTYDSRVSESNSRALKALCQSRGATLFMGLQAAFSVLLARYSNETDIVMGSPVANREQTEIANLIGFFVNTLVLRSDLSGNPSFNQLLLQSKAMLLDAYAHQQVPFEQIVERLQPERSLSHSPLFQIMLVLQNNEEGTLNLPGLTLSPVMQGRGGAAKYDLTLTAVENEQGLQLGWEYNTDLFEPDTIARMAGHFEILLESLVKSPEASVFGSNMLTEDEQHQLLVEWNATEADYPRDTCIHELFEAQVEQNPNAVAVIFEDQQLTYGELNRKANQLAHYLIRERGVKPDTLVGICVERSLEMVIGILAILKAGGAYVPLDPEYPEARLQYMLEDADLSTVITQSHIKEKINLSEAQAISLDDRNTQEHLASQSQENINSKKIGLKSNHLAYVIFTSGSTGNPKGVMVEQSSVISLVINNNYVPLSPKTIMLQSAPVAFDAATFEIWGALLNGGQMVIQGSSLIDMTSLGNFINDYGINTAWMTVGLFDQFVTIYDIQLPSLNYLLVGGDVVNRHSVNLIKSRNEHLNVINGYGPTENTTFSFCYLIPQDINALRSIPIGKPLSNRKAYVLDVNLKLCSPGVPGQLYLTGVGLARGYLNSAELTAEKFIVNPFYSENDSASSKRLYKTGDLVRWLADGNLEFLGRIDHQVKIRGFRIELGEIENTLTTNTAVKQAAVIVDSSTESKRLLAYLVPMQPLILDQDKQQNAEVNFIAQAKAELQRQLPEYMVPHIFVVLAELPLTVNGKLDRQALPKANIAAQIQDNYVAPRSVTEQILCSLWQDLLSLEKVGVNDNFFSLGGDSILSIQLISRANQHGITLTTRQLFEHQTIAELAHYYDTQNADVIAKISQCAVGGKQILLPIHRELLAGDQLDLHHFNQSVLLNTPKNFPKECLHTIAKAIYERHDVLRLRYNVELKSEANSLWHAEYAPLFDQMINETCVVENLPNNKLTMNEWISQRCQYWQGQLHLSQGPLWRMVYFQQKPGIDSEHNGYLFIVAHHLVIDGVSWRILIQDIEQVYQQYLNCKVINLPAKTASMQHWGNILVEAAKTEQLQEEKSFWLQQYQQDIKALRQDIYPQLPAVEASTRRVSFNLSVNQTTNLLQHCGRAYSTRINELLLAGICLGFRVFTGQNGLRITIEGHGREEFTTAVDLTGTLGWFTSTWPLQLTYSGSEVGNVIREVKEKCRAVPNKGIGYGLLRWILCDEDIIQAEMSNAPQLVFNYLGQFDQSFNEKSAFNLAIESAGDDVSKRRRRSHLLGLNGQIINGQLSFALDYSDEQYFEDTIHQLSDQLVIGLHQVIDHCLAVSETCFTPSDFPLVKVDQRQLETWQQDYGKIKKLYPATSMQQGMFYHSLVNKSSYIAQSFPVLKGRINSEYFREAWLHVIRRHDILRSVFISHSEQLLQMVLEEVQLPWHEEDWRALSAQQQEQKFFSLLAADKAQGFDLAQGPMLRISLFRTTDDSYRLMWSHHHIIIDGWSLAIIYREVMAIYETLCAGVSHNLPPSVPFENYINWLVTRDKLSAASYWKDQLQGIYAPTALPPRLFSEEKRTSSVRLHENIEYHYNECKLTLSCEQTQGLQNLAKEQQVTVNSLLQLAWAYLLHTYSGEDNIVFGATIAGRPPAVFGIENMVGLFINSIPVMVSFTEVNSVRRLLATLHKSIQLAGDNGFISLNEIQRQSSIPIGTSLFNSLLVFENFPMDMTLAARDLSTKSDFYMESYQGEARSHYPLTLSASLNPQLNILCEYRQEEYEATDIYVLLEHLQHILVSLESHLTCDIHQLELLTSVEKQQVSRWQQAYANYPSLCIHQLIEQQVAVTPDNIAVICTKGTMTYRQLNEQANQLAHYLIAQGVMPGMLVGLCCDRSKPMMIGLLGILKSGAAYVPLDPSYPVERLQYMLNDSELNLVLTQSQWLDKFKDNLKGENNSKNDTELTLMCLDERNFQITLSQYSSENPSLKNKDFTPNSLAYVMYTSGSTGNPKGVMISHHAVSNYLHYARQTYIKENIRGAVVSLPLAFDATITVLFTPLCSGCYVELLPENNQLIETLADYLLDDEESLLFKLTPAHLAALANLNSLSTLNYSKAQHIVVVGGEQLMANTLNSWINELLPYAIFFNEYGPTETVVGCSVYRIDGRGSQHPIDLQGNIPIGKPIHNAELYVLNSQLVPLPVGAPGELYIGGSGVARGYWNRDTLTAEKFIKNSFSAVSGKTMYKTGDRVRWLPGGNLEFIGRVDEQVKIRGYRIELGEIEYHLSRLPNVSEVAVVCQSAHHIYKNENEKIPSSGEQRLVAYLVLNSNGLVDSFSSENERIAEFREILSQTLPVYMLPSSFVVLPMLPLTANGKVDKKLLSDKQVENHFASQDDYAAPESEIEKILCSIWENLLGRKRVGVNDNFFTVGGDSILSILFVSRANQAGIPITTKQFYHYQTIATLVAQLGETDVLNKKRLAQQTPVEGICSLLPIQRRFFEWAHQDRNHFNHALLLVPPIDFECSALEPIVRALYERHDALRLRFSQNKTGEWQAKHVPLSESLLRSSWAIETLADDEVGFQDLLEQRCEYWQRSLDITNGPLLRFVYFYEECSQNDLEKARSRLFILVHHLVMDGVSWRVLLDDLSQSYKLYHAAEPLLLAPKTTSLQHWGEKLQHCISGVDEVCVVANERSFWLAQHQQVFMPWQLKKPFPASVDEERAKVSSSCQIQLYLSKTETQSLLQKALRPYQSRIEELLIVGVYLGIAEWSEQKELCIMIEGHGRNSIWEGLDVSQTIGWFTTLFPMLLQSDSLDIPQVIKQFKEQRRAVPNGGIGYGLLCEQDAELAAIAKQNPPLLLFNYLGQIDQSLNSDQLFSRALEPCGQYQSSLHLREFPLILNGLISDGVLSFSLDYSQEEFSQESIEELAKFIEMAWSKIVAHCLQAEESYTPSDFPSARASQLQIDEWQKKYHNFTRLYLATPMQQGMFFHSLFDQSTYIIQQYPIIQGKLNPQHFRQAWQEVVTRQDVMRTVFVGQTQELHQLVLPSTILPWHEEDWRDISHDQQVEKFADYREKDRALGFDFGKAPLLRLSLLRLGENRYQLLWTIHHLICDGWSTPLIYNEVMRSYKALSSNNNRVTVSINAPAAPFENYIKWLQSQDIVKAKAYWRERLLDITGPTPLVIDKLSSNASCGWYKESQFLSLEQTEQLQSLAQARRTTLNSLLQLAWGYLLHCYSGESTVVFGTTVSGRPAAVNGIENMIGLFINTIPVVISFAGHPRVEDVLSNVHEEFQRSNDYAWLSLAEIQHLSAIPRGASLFDSQLMFANYPLQTNLAEATQLGELTIESLAYDDRNNYKLAIDVSLEPQLHLVCGYLSEEFSSATIKRLLSHFAQILISLSANIDSDIHAIELLTTSELQQLERTNQTWIDSPKDRAVHELFEAQVVKTPKAIAVISKEQGKEKRLSYQELNERANKIAWSLLDAGLVVDDIVAVLAERDSIFLSSILGVLKAGGAWLSLDPNSPSGRYQQILQQSGISLVICSQSMKEKLDQAINILEPSSCPKVLLLDDIVISMDDNEQDKQSKNNPSIICELGNLSYVIYTSGSTGRPKGAMLTHGGLLNHLQAKINYLSLDAHDVMAQTATQSFDISVWQFLNMLLVGGCVSIFDHWEASDPVSLIDKVQRDRVTVLQLVPTVMRMLVEEVEHNPHKHTQLSGLRWMIQTGEAAVLQTCRRWFDLYPEIPLMNAYGPAECSDDVCLYVMREALPEEATSVPIGLPIMNTELYVLDAYGRRVPIGVTGEIYIGGLGVGRGYLGDPVQTAARFVPDIFSGRIGATLYRTGDLGRWLPSGQLDFVNRVDNQLKIRGFRIELEEIEFQLRQLPTIREAVVIARGEGEDKQLIGYVVPSINISGMVSDAGNVGEKVFYDAINANLKLCLPEYMIPSSFVTMEKLPLNSNGKIDRRALPDFSRALIEPESYVAPETETEIVLAELWCKILGLDKVSATTNFFTLGGHSLTATRLVSVCREKFDRQISIRSLYEHSTIRQLASHIESQQKRTWRAVSRISRQGSLPLSFAQQSLWLIDQVEGSSVQYNIPVVLKLVGELDVEVLSLSLDEVVYRHEALRTTFPTIDGRAQQIIHESPLLDIPQIDLRDMEADEQKLKLAQLMELEARKSFQLHQDFPFRAKLIQLNEREYIFLFTMHHIASDAWSMNILVKEILSLYGAFSQGQASPLEPLEIQYADYAHWQHQYLAGPGTDNKLQWWKQSLDGAPEVHSLTLDYPRGVRQNFAGNSLKIHLEKDQLKLLYQLATQHNASLFMLLQTAFSLFIGRLSHCDDVVIGSPVAGRTHKDTEAMIGFFVNVLVLRTDLSGNPNFSDLLMRSQEHILTAYEHQDIPFELLVRHLQPERSLSYSPLFQIVFSLQNAEETAFSIPGLDVADLGDVDRNAKYELILDVKENHKGIDLNWIYAESLFERSTIERMAQNFMVLLQSILTDCNIPISHLSMLRDEEFNQLREWQVAPVKEFLPNKTTSNCIFSRFLMQARATPSAIAVVNGTDELSYTELEKLVGRLTQVLITQGVRRGMLIGLCVDRSFEMVIGMLAILKAGAAYVPLDPSYPEERLQRVRADADLSMILTQAHLVQQVNLLNIAVVVLDKNQMCEELDEADYIDENTPRIAGSDLAYVIYTSGSSGTPKGVMVEHHSVLNLIDNPNYASLNEKTIVLQISSIAFDAATFEIWGSLLNGGRLVLFAEQLVDISILNQHLLTHHVNTLFLTTGLFEQWSYQLPQTCDLKWLLTGGEKGNPNAVDRVYSTLPDVSVIHVYGPTENTTFSCYYPIPKVSGGIISMHLGRAVTGSITYVLKESKVLAAIGEVGELHLSGSGLARGYINQPQLTDSKFIANPFYSDVQTSEDKSARLYKTGDLVRWLPNGQLEFVGRVDQQVKIRGFRIEPGEVEEQLNRLSQVQTSFVSVIGETVVEKRLVAWLVVEAGVPFSDEKMLVETIRAELIKCLPDYMIPAAFVVLPELPLNINGKIDIRALPRPDYRLDKDNVEPRTSVEKNLAVIWKDLLALEQISVNDNFFHLGGHSLLATQMVSEIRATFDVDLPLREIFERQTISNIATELDKLLIKKRNHFPVGETEGIFEMDV